MLRPRGRVCVLAQSLSPHGVFCRRGGAFYETFRAAMHSWLLFNADKAAKPLCAAAGGAKGAGAQPVALRVLGGTLEALLRARQPGNLGDLRQRWGLGYS